MITDIYNRKLKLTFDESESFDINFGSQTVVALGSLGLFAVDPERTVESYSIGSDWPNGAVLIPGIVGRNRTTQ